MIKQDSKRLQSKYGIYLTNSLPDKLPEVYDNFFSKKEFIYIKKL